MADRVKGITIEIGGDTSSLQKALKGVDKQLKTTQSTLKDVDKLLKLDPGNVELLIQKQKNLEKAIEETKNRLSQLKDAQKGVKEGTPEWDNLQREIIATEQSLKSLEKEHKNFGSVSRQVVKAAGEQMQEFGGKVEAAGRKLQPLSTAATGVLTAIGGLAYKSVTAADDLNTLAKQTGLSTAELQKMQYASDLVDVSVSDITGALKKLKPKITEDNAALAALGVATTNADGSLRDVNDVFYDTLTALSQIENETERDQMAMELFGKGADSLAGIIDDGGAALREYGEEAENLGIILDQNTLDALNATNDVLDEMKMKIGGSLATFGATAAQVLAPALEKVAGIIDKVTEKLRNLTPEQTETIMKILGVVAAIAPVLIIGGKIISLVGKVTSVLSALNPVTLVIMAVVAAGVLLYKNWDTIKAKAQEIGAQLSETWGNVKTSVVSAVDSLKAGVKKAWDGVVSAINAAIDKIRGKIDAAKQKFNDLKNTISNVIQNIKNAFNFNWELPRIKLPHFKVEGGEFPYGLGGEGKLPSISIDWYKKAYDNPVMFKQPTVLATPQGYKGFGDGHGAEIVMGIDKLQQLVGAQSGNVVINVYPSPGMNVDQLAEKIQQKYVAAARMRRLANA